MSKPYFKEFRPNSLVVCTNGALMTGAYLESLKVPPEGKKEFDKWCHTEIPTPLLLIDLPAKQADLDMAIDFSVYIYSRFKNSRKREIPLHSNIEIFLKENDIAISEDGNLEEVQSKVRQAITKKIISLGLCDENGKIINANLDEDDEPALYAVDLPNFKTLDGDSDHPNFIASLVVRGLPSPVEALNKIPEWLAILAIDAGILVYQSTSDFSDEHNFLGSAGHENTEHQGPMLITINSTPIAKLSAERARLEQVNTVFEELFHSVQFRYGTCTLGKPEDYPSMGEWLHELVNGEKYAFKAFAKKVASDKPKLKEIYNLVKHSEPNGGTFFQNFDESELHVDVFEAAKYLGKTLAPDEAAALLRKTFTDPVVDAVEKLNRHYISFAEKSLKRLDPKMPAETIAAIVEKWRNDPYNHERSQLVSRIITAENPVSLGIK